MSEHLPHIFLSQVPSSMRQAWGDLQKEDAASRLVALEPGTCINKDCSQDRQPNYNIVIDYTLYSLYIACITLFEMCQNLPLLCNFFSSADLHNACVYTLWSATSLSKPELLQMPFCMALIGRSLGYSKQNAHKLSSRALYQKVTYCCYWTWLVGRSQRYL